MRHINSIIIHCSATRPEQDIGADIIRHWHQRQGWRDIGYHHIIRRDGTLELGRAETQAGAHVKGHNAHSIGICLIGGIDAQGRPEPNYTQEQLHTLRHLVDEIKARHPIRTILGHRDCSPDKDGNGIVEPHEWVKHCPCFDVDTWLRTGQVRNLGTLYAPTSYTFA